MTSRIGITYRMRWGHAAIAALLFAAAFVVLISGGTSSPADAVGAARSLAAPAPASAPADPTAVDPHLRQLAARRPGASAEGIVQFDGSVAPTARRRLVAAAGGQVTRELHIIPGLAVRMAAAKAVELGDAAGVRAVSLNAAIKTSLAGAQAVPTANLQTTFPKSTHAAGLWNKPGGGFTGKGVGVGVIDTANAGDMSHLQGPERQSRVVQS